MWLIWYNFFTTILLRLVNKFIFKFFLALPQNMNFISQVLAWKNGAFGFFKRMSEFPLWPSGDKSD